MPRADRAAHQVGSGWCRLLHNKHRVVPLALATPGSDGFHVPYDTATVTDAPNLDLDDDLPAAQVTALYRHTASSVDEAPNQPNARP